MKYWYKNEVSGYYKEGMSAPTTRDNVDIVTAFYYDVCDEAAKRVDNVD